MRRRRAVSAAIGFTWYGKTPSYSVDVNGSGPQPVDPGKLSFTAAWDTGLLGLGKPQVQIQKFDGKGGLTFEDRPYVIMNDHAYADLGYIK